MKTVSSVARILIGVMFTLFGLNGFLHFIPMGPPPTGLAGQYLGALAMSHYLAVVFAIQSVAGVLVLVNRYLPLVLTTLAAIIVNILLFHIFMAPAGLPLALFAAILWLGSVWNVRSAFAGLLKSRVTSSNPEPGAPGDEKWAAATR